MRWRPLYSGCTVCQFMRLGAVMSPWSPGCRRPIRPSNWRRGIRRRGCIQQQDVGIEASDIGENVVGRDATSGETDLMSVALQGLI